MGPPTCLAHQARQVGAIILMPRPVSSTWPRRLDGFEWAVWAEWEAILGADERRMGAIAGALRARGVSAHSDRVSVAESLC